MKKLYVRNDDGSFEEIAGLLTGPHLKPIKKTKIESAVSKYIAQFSNQKRSASKEKTYFKNFLEFFKNQNLIYLDEIEQTHLEQLQNELLKTKQPSTVNRQFTTYCHFLTKCVEHGQIHKSPAQFIKKKKETTPERRLWTANEINEITKKAPEWFKNAFLFLGLTGCRPIELCNLRKSDFNKDDFSVVLTCHKNSGNKRTIPLSQPAAKLILKLIKNKKDSDYIFLSSVQTRLSTDRLNKTLAKLQKRFLLAKISIYALRHTYATSLCNQGVNLELVRLLLGHSQIRTTQKYVKADFLSLKKVVDGG